MLSLDQEKFEKTLVSLNLVSPENLEKAKIESVRSGREISEVLENLAIVSSEDIIKAGAISLGMPYVDLRSTDIDPNMLKQITKETAAKFQSIIFGKNGNMLNVAMVDPNNIQAIDFIERKTGLRTSVYMTSDESIAKALDQYPDFSAEENTPAENVTTQSASSESEGDEGITKKPNELENLIQDAPVTREVNTILDYAVKIKASDIHIEPREKSVKIRYRVDGILQEKMTLPIHIHPALVSRIKILSDLKIDEHRLPQDGRFGANIEGKDIDIRVSLSPTVHGEKVVMRLLDKSGGVITLEELGLVGRGFQLLEGTATREHGMILSTGPTGSGKTTTLYALLTKMNTPSINIITLEDPIEYQIEGVNQIQVNAPIGLTFAAGLRSILRQDPNVIMVGEIRDKETADLAVQSSLTGHKVLSTLHTNSAAGVLPRLLDMDIEPFLIASTVSVIIGQRLVRKLCSSCRQSYTASPSLFEGINKNVGRILPSTTEEAKKIGYENLPQKNSKAFTLWKAKGCDKCNGSGYSGRIGIYEVFPMSPAIEKLVISHATTSEVQNQAVAEGMITMRQDGFLKALIGVTSLEEVLAKTSEY